MSSWYFNFGLLATQLAGAAIVLGLASIPILVLFACNSTFKSNPHWLPPFYQKAATCAILGIVQVVILLILQLIFPDVSGLSLSPTALHYRAEAPPAPQVHWSTYMWGTTTILFGLHTVWNQTVNYLLNKEKWTAEKANLEAEKAALEAKKAALENNKVKVNDRLRRIEKEITHLQKVTLEDV